MSQRKIPIIVAPGSNDPRSAAGPGPARENSSAVWPNPSTEPGLPPLSLYVHLPWCLSKCPYCDFNSHEHGGTSLPEQAYVDALITDLDAALPGIWGRSVSTIFFGGGTPSLFSGEAIDRLLGAIRARLRLIPDAEITLEANPGTFERDRFAEFAAAGVNRLSIGVQSFDDAALDRLGRVHDSNQARQAIGTAAELFDSFNVDLMFALPDQTMATLETDLGELARWSPPHVSLYHLTLEPNTRFARFVPENLPDDDTAADMAARIGEVMGGLGLTHYEVSAYGRAGHECRHNLNYWRFGDYLGIGAGAHSKISYHDRVVRQARYRHPDRYMRTASSGGAIEQSRELDVEDLRFEFMLNALRLIQGVPRSLFEAQTRLDINSFGSQLDDLVDEGLLEDDPIRLRASELGRRFLDELIGRFLPVRA